MLEKGGGGSDAGIVPNMQGSKEGPGRGGVRIRTCLGNACYPACTQLLPEEVNVPVHRVLAEE